MSTGLIRRTVVASTAADGRPRTAYRPDVQGLRAVAVLAVVAYHARVPGVSGGYVGVDVFFVISGFLITQLLWREWSTDQHISLCRFYARRIRRLLPASALVLVSTMVAAAFLLPPLRIAGTARDAVAAALYSANYRFALAETDYLAGATAPSPVQHFWSLGVEEQFYLLFPVLLLLAAFARRPRTLTRAGTAAGLAAAGTASFGLCLYLTEADQPWAFYSLPSRAWELAAGGLLALALPWVHRLPRQLMALIGWVGAASIACAVFGFDSTTGFPGAAALVPVGGAGALLAAGAVAPGRGPAALLAHRGAQGIGAISYSWYLWHWPVLVLGGLLWHGTAAEAGLVAISAGLAAATWKLVENPVRRSATLARGSARSISAGVMLSAVTAAVAIVVASTTPAPTGSAPSASAPDLTGRPVGTAPEGTARTTSTAQQRVLGAVAAAAAVRSVPVNLTPSLDEAPTDKAAPFLDGCNLGFTESRSPSCVYGDRAGRIRVTTFGDSHAAQWIPALDGIAVRRHWRLENLSKSTCPPFPLHIYSPALGRGFHECEQWRVSALQRIRLEKPDLVIVSVARHYGDEYGFSVGQPPWVEALEGLVRDLHQQGSKVLVLGATPKPPGNVPDCLSQHLDSVPACTDPWSVEVDLQGAGRERAATERAGGTFVDVAPWICTPNRCAVILGNLLVFRDDNHITTSFARWLSPVLEESLTAAMRAPH